MQRITKDFASRVLGCRQDSPLSESTGRVHPDAPASSLTITGLAPGEYAVFVRARYDDYRNGPFKKSARVVVVGSAAQEEATPTPAPTLEATPVPTAAPNPAPTPTPTPEPTLQPGAITGLTLTSSRPGQLWVSWDESDPAPTEYRLNWAPVDQPFPSWNSNQGGNIWFPGTEIVKGGAILCHVAEQRRTTGRSVFSMSVTLRWASAEDLSGIERGAV